MADKTSISGANQTRDFPEQTNKEFTKEVNLKDGDIFTANGKEYVFKAGKITEVKPKSEGPHFKLIFRKSGGFGLAPEACDCKDCKCEENEKFIEVDIYPLLKKVLGERRVSGAHVDFAGVEYQSGEGVIGERSVNLTYQDVERLKREMDNIFGAGISNGRQFESMHNLAFSLLDSPFDRFHRLMW